MAERLRLEMVIRAVDRATAPLRRIAAGVRRLSRETGLDRVRAALGGVGRGLGRVGRQALATFRNIALAAGGAGAAIVGLVGRFAGAGDDIAKNADKLGLGVVELQRYRYAAELAGVKQRVFDMAIQRFTRRVAEAAAGTGEAYDVLRAAGIELVDQAGKIRPTGELFEEVADKMMNLDDPAKRVRNAFKLFDSEGVVMVNLMRQGADAIRAAGDEAERFGVITEAEARAAERYTDQMTRTRRAVSFLGHTIGADLLPEAEGLARRLAEWAVEARPRVLAEMRGAMRDFGRAVAWVRERWGPLVEWMGRGLDRLRRLHPAVGRLVDRAREVAGELGPVRIAALAAAGALTFKLGLAILGLFAPLARLGLALALFGGNVLRLAGRPVGALLVGLGRLAAATGIFGRAAAGAARTKLAATFASIGRALLWVGRAVPVIGVLAALGSAVYLAWRPISTFFRGLAEGVRDSAGDMAGPLADLRAAFADLLAAAGPVGGALRSAWAAVRDFFDADATETGRGWGAAIVEGAVGVVRALTAVAEAFQAVARLFSMDWGEHLRGAWDDFKADASARLEADLGVEGAERVRGFFRRGADETAEFGRNRREEERRRGEENRASFAEGASDLRRLLRFLEENQPTSRASRIVRDRAAARPTPDREPARRAGLAGAEGRVDVGGEVRIRIEDETRRARVESVRTDNRDVDIDVSAGYVMGGV